MAASAMRVVISLIERIASSLPGMTKLTLSGSQLVSVMAMTGMPILFASCTAIDVMRLRYRARPLRRLVEIRGREHLDAALAGGKGAILCSAHFGSFDSCFSLLGASGYPVTTIGRWQHNYTAGLSSAERRFWDLVCARRLRRRRGMPRFTITWATS